VTWPQREHPRYAHEAAITFITPGQEVAGRTTNLSRGGLCATLSEQLATGAEIQIDIQLVFEDGRQSEALRVPARVVWCTGLDDGYQVGVQFLALDARITDDLTMFLRYLDDEGGDEQPAAVSLDERFG
jgi:c-di-GMP-binding flagellar brake protein YcgR